MALGENLEHYQAIKWDGRLNTLDELEKVLKGFKFGIAIDGESLSIELSDKEDDELWIGVGDMVVRSEGNKIFKIKKQDFERRFVEL